MNIGIGGQVSGRVTARPSGQVILGHGNTGNLSVSLEGRGYGLAKAARKNGIDCKLVTWVGDDPIGESSLRELEREGVDISHVCRKKDKDTIINLEVKNLVDELDLGVYYDHNLEEKESYPWKAIKKGLQGLIFDGSLSTSEMENAIEEFSGFLAFAPESLAHIKRIENLLEKMDFLFLDRKGGELLCNMDILSKEQVKVAGRLLIEKGVGNAIFLLGGGGIYTFQEEKELFYSLEELRKMDLLGSFEEMAIKWLSSSEIRERK